MKLGQQSVDQEFMTSQGSSLFLNTVMGWPMVPSADLYAGGPAYPLSSLGVRLRTQPGHGITALLGVFADNPPGGPFNDDGQLRGSTRWGGNFNLRTGALVIGEIQYALNQPGNGDVVHGATRLRPAGHLQAGLLVRLQRPFPDQQFDNTGLSLADPASTGIALMRWNNFSIYGVADQMVWRPSEDSPRSVSVFARLMGAPGDRNLINFSVNAGITLKAPLRGSRRRHGGDRLRHRAGQRRSTGFRPLGRLLLRHAQPGPHHRNLHRGHLSVQLSRPGGRCSRTSSTCSTPAAASSTRTSRAKRIGNEAIFGLRSTMTF